MPSIIIEFLIYLYEAYYIRYLDSSSNILYLFIYYYYKVKRPIKFKTIRKLI